MVPWQRASAAGRISWVRRRAADACGVEVPTQRPLVFLQSVLEKPEIGFVSLPVRTIRPDYELALNDDDLSALRFDDDIRPEIGTRCAVVWLMLFPSDGSLEA